MPTALWYILKIRPKNESEYKKCSLHLLCHRIRSDLSSYSIWRNNRNTFQLAKIEIFGQFLEFSEIYLTVYMGEKCMFQNIVDFPIEVDSKNWTKIAKKKWYDNCAVLRLLRQIE